VNPETRSPIARIAREWIGTPFVPQARIKRAGVDCVNLPAAILIEARVLDSVITGPYTIDAGRHASVSQLVAWLRKDGRFDEWPVSAPPAPLEPLIEGDLVAFRIGHGVAHHVGLVVSPHGGFVHCLRGHGVIESTLQDPTYRRLFTHHFRPRWPSALPTT